MYYVSSYNLISDRVEIFISVKCDMRKCRNWQTSKTKDLVSIALVWVQVPSSAFFIKNLSSYSQIRACLKKALRHKGIFSFISLNFILLNQDHYDYVDFC